MITLWGDSYWASPAQSGYIAIMLGRWIYADIQAVARGGASSRDVLDMMGERPDRLPGVAIFSMGRCNYEDGPERIVADHKRAVDMLGHDRFLVAPMTRTRRRGTVCFELCEAINDALRDFAGDRFIDTQGHIIANGLALAGIMPTRRDERDIGGGIVPASLRCDAIHLNRAGNEIVARFIADELIRRQWAPARPEALVA